jgi:TolB-like protein
VKLLAAVAIAICLPTTALATGPSTLAVTFFDNNSSDADFDPLGRGLAAMLITDLSNVEGLALVERTRVHELMAEHTLQKSPWIDPTTAAEMGRGLGAEYILTGAFAAIEPTMRIDARIISVQDGTILHSAEVTGPVDEFFLLEKELASSIVEGLKVDVSARENARMGRVATESFDAFLTWSRGLDALDRGEIERAREQLQAALDHDDRFAMANDAMDALSKRVDTLRDRREEAVSERTSSILAKIDVLADSGGPYDPLQNELLAVLSLSYYQDASDLHALGSKLMDLELGESLRMGGPKGWISINEWAMSQYVLACHALGRRAEFLSYGEGFLTRYPASTFHLVVSNFMSQMLDQIKREEAGRDGVSKLRVEAMGAAQEQKCQLERDPVVQFEACRAWVEDAMSAGVTVDEDAEEMWARAAARRGLLDEIERLHRAALARDKYSEQAQGIGRVLERAKSNREGAAKAVARLEKRKADAEATANDYVHTAFDLKDGGKLSDAMALLEEAVEQWPGEARPYRDAVTYQLEYGNPRVAQAWLTRWEAAAPQGAEVDPSTARRVRSYDEDTAHVGEADALGLVTLGQKMNEAAQYREAGDAYLRLGKEHADNRYLPAGTAYYLAGAAYRQASMNQDARDAWEAGLRLHPESDMASVTRRLLDTLAK